LNNKKVEIMRDFSELVSGLSVEEVGSLMNRLCRSGKVVIPQFYTTEHIKTITGLEPSLGLMTQVQENYEWDDDLMDILNEKLHLFVEE
jgi:hypothetical protein